MDLHLALAFKWVDFLARWSTSEITRCSPPWCSWLACCASRALRAGWFSGADRMRPCGSVQMNRDLLCGKKSGRFFVFVYNILYLGAKRIFRMSYLNSMPQNVWAGETIYETCSWKGPGYFDPDQTPSYWGQLCFACAMRSLPGRSWKRLWRTGRPLVTEALGVTCLGWPSRCCWWESPCNLEASGHKRSQPVWKEQPTEIWWVNVSYEYAMLAQAGLSFRGTFLLY